jgi:hypothetical protein
MSSRRSSGYCGPWASTCRRPVSGPSASSVVLGATFGVPMTLAMTFITPGLGAGHYATLGLVGGGLFGGLYGLYTRHLRRKLNLPDWDSLAA